MAAGMELETLLTCSDGSYDPILKTGSHGWVVATSDKEVLAQGAGLADGNPSLLSSYCTELGGLSAILYTIYCVCQYYQVTSGKVALIPVTVIAGWVKGHYTGKHREYKHDLNDRVDHLADKHNKRPNPAFIHK
jgi:hypothetical protein